MKVSIIIPCYNGEEYIGQTIGSVFEQTYKVDEIIVVDDGSTDRSAEIARSFGKKVTVLSKGGGGAANARNYGAGHATGDALMFLDADDVLGPDVIEHLVTQLERYPNEIAACPWFRLEKSGERWVQRPPSCAKLGPDQDYLGGWITGWYHLPCSILWSRSAYERTGGWDPRAYVNDDGDLMMRALVDRINLRITDKGASFYRRMPEGMESESLSGARFTREGREAQIYVINKIANMLEERGMLKDYRKPITLALSQLARLCQAENPDLSRNCQRLINRYGEPRYLRIARTANRRLRNVARIGLNRTYRLKSQLMNLLRASGAHDDHQLPSPEKTEEVEITYGLREYKKAAAQL